MVYKGLKFDYATMTFVWPFILGAFGLLLRMLSMKRQAVLSELILSAPTTTIVASDPWYFSVAKGSNMLAILTWLIRYLPAVALFTMLACSFSILDSTLVGFLFQVAGILFGLCCMPALWYGLNTFWVQTEPSEVHVQQVSTENAKRREDAT
jgi:hypothetical protein